MKKIEIRLDVKEMVYDVQNKTYLTGKSRRDGNNHERVANMQANDDDDNANQIMRSISMACSNLYNVLGEYISAADNKGTNELPEATGEIVYMLTMPSNYNRSTVATIAEACHRYVVASAIADWFTITNKADAQDYVAESKNCLVLISEAVSRRERPVKGEEAKPN